MIRQQHKLEGACARGVFNAILPLSNTNEEGTVITADAHGVGTEALLFAEDAAALRVSAVAKLTQAFNLLLGPPTGKVFYMLDGQEANSRYRSFH